VLQRVFTPRHRYAGNGGRETYSVRASTARCDGVELGGALKAREGVIWGT